MKKLWRLSLPLLLAALLLAACGQGAEETPPPEEAPPAEDTAPETEESKAPEDLPEGAMLLTAEEVDRVNEAFAPAIVDEKRNMTLANPLSSFFTCYYQTPEEIDLAEFLAYCSLPAEDGESAQDTVSPEEYAALTALEDWPFGRDRPQENMPVPIHRFPRDRVDAFLTERTGVATADLIGGNAGERVLLYLEEYDAYYNFTSDFGPGFFQCESGWYTDTEARLTGANAVLTLRKREDRWLFQSFLPIEDGRQ